MTADKKIDAFLKELGSKEPIPSGGGACGVCAAIGTTLGVMVIRMTSGKKKYAAYEERLEALLNRLLPAGERFLSLADADEEVFLPLAKAYGLPSGTETERLEKERVMEIVLRDAAAVPLSLMELCVETLRDISELTEIGSKMVISDVGVAARQLSAALEGGYMNVVINAKSFKDREAADDLRKKGEALLREGRMLSDRIYEEVLSQLG